MPSTTLKASCVLLGLLFAAYGCAPSHAGRTLGRGVIQVEGGIGGPFAKNLGVPIPVPNIPIGARYGIKNWLDVSSHVNLLPIIMGGFLALDASLTWALVRHDGPKGWNLATGTGFVFFSDFDNGARIGPLMDIAGGYTINRFTPFAGIELTVDCWGPGVIWNPFVGLEIDIKKTTLSAAAIWYNPTFDAYTSSVDYVSPGYHGSVGLIIGVKHHLFLLGKIPSKEPGK
jgi:hypothetical protein